jgi:hypothetical protein
MTGAVSVTVCLLEDAIANCVAEHGLSARKSGRCIVVGSHAALERLNNGRQFQSLDAAGDVRLDCDLCRELGVRSLLAVPIQHDEKTEGLIEVRWGLRDALHECDVRTCRLMANLLAEILARENQVTLQPSRTPVFADEEADKSEPDRADEDITAPVGASPESTQSEPELASQCRVCGRAFAADEAFCGNCSMPRVAASADADGLQSKWASMWFMQQAQDTLQERKAAARKPSLPPISAPLVPVKFTAPRAQARLPQISTAETDRVPETKSEPDEPLFTEAPKRLPGEHTIRILEDTPAPESNLTSMLEYLRPLKTLRFKVSRKGAMLAVVSMIAVLFLATWLSWASRPASQLTWFESLLVELGLAEVHTHARPAPVYAGSPDVRVWEDVHTALYYCPDSDLYGKTPGGRFSTQRSAQEDQFEPATRVVCR